MEISALAFCPRCGSAYSQTAQEGFAHTCETCCFTLYENQSATASAIIFSQGKLLLVQRAREPNLGAWDFPGGFVEPNEHPLQAMVREVKEELGAKIDCIELFGVYGPTKYEYQGTINYNCDLYYFAQLTSDPAALKPADDVAKAAWFSINTLPQSTNIAFPAQITLLDDLRQRPALWS